MYKVNMSGLATRMSGYASDIGTTFNSATAAAGRQWRAIPTGYKVVGGITLGVGGLAVAVTAAFGARTQNEADIRQRHFDKIKDGLSSEKQKEAEKILTQDHDKNIFSILGDNAEDEYDKFLTDNGIDSRIYPFSGGE